MTFDLAQKIELTSKRIHLLKKLSKPQKHFKQADGLGIRRQMPLGFWLKLENSGHSGVEGATEESLGNYRLHYQRTLAVVVEIPA